MRYRKNAFTPEEKKFLFRGKCVLKKSKMKWKREEDRHDIEESYEILENYYQNIYGMYDDNWIDYDLDVAFTKLQLEKSFKKDISWITRRK